MDKQIDLKTITLGRSTVGKTSVIVRLKGDKFTEETVATVGASFMMAKRGNIKYNVWDTGGQERFRCLMPMYIRDSKIVIFVFDVTDMVSLDILDTYKEELNALENYQIIIVGNKMDLLNDVQLKMAVEAFNKKRELLELKECIYDGIFVSAKTGECFDNFLEILHNCAKEIIRKNENNHLDNISKIELKPIPVTKTEEVEPGCSC